MSAHINYHPVSLPGNLTHDQIGIVTTTKNVPEGARIMSYDEVLEYHKFLVHKERNGRLWPLYYSNTALCTGVGLSTATAITSMAVHLAPPVFATVLSSSLGLAGGMGIASIIHNENIKRPLLLGTYKDNITNRSKLYLKAALSHGATTFMSTLLSAYMVVALSGVYNYNQRSDLLPHNGMKAVKKLLKVTRMPTLFAVSVPLNALMAVFLTHLEFNASKSLYSNQWTYQPDNTDTSEPGFDRDNQ